MRRRWRLGGGVVLSILFLGVAAGTRSVLADGGHGHTLNVQLIIAKSGAEKLLEDTLQQTSIEAGEKQTPGMGVAAALSAAAAVAAVFRRRV